MNLHKNRFKSFSPSVKESGNKTLEECVQKQTSPKKYKQSWTRLPPLNSSKKSKLMPGTAIDTMEDAGLNPGQSTKYCSLTLKNTRWKPLKQLARSTKEVIDYTVLPVLPQRYTKIFNTSSAEGNKAEDVKNRSDR